MPSSLFKTWPLIALLLPVTATAQDPTPEAATPDATAPEPATPESIAPEATGPEAVAPEAAAPETATPGTDAPETASPGAEDPDETPPVAPGAETGEGGSGLSLGAQGELQVGDVYAREAFTDWELRCEVAESGEDPCQLYQLLQDQNDNSVAEISVFSLPPGSQAEAGATIVTPLETLLTEQIAMTVDGGSVKRYPFSFCTSIGCIARVGFTSSEVAAFRRGQEATLTIAPAQAPDQEVTLTVSLAGFTAGLDAVRASGGGAPEGTE